MTRRSADIEQHPLNAGDLAAAPALRDPGDIVDEVGEGHRASLLISPKTSCALPAIIHGYA
jgi:hypothetical protein